MESQFSLNPEAPVLVIGTAGVDIVGRMKGELAMGMSTPASIRSSYGGVARNVAENLARLGQKVRLITSLGYDYAGDQLIQQAIDAGVDMESVVRTYEHPTGAYLAMINANGELQFALDDMRASSALTPEYLETHESLFKQSSLLFIDANLSKPTIRKAISLARKARIPICADPTAAGLSHRLRPHLGKLAMITPNHVEAGILFGEQIDAQNISQIHDAAKWMVSQGVTIAIITLAQFGVFYATSETSGQVPAIRTEIVDPTGGGDALSAAVIYAILNQIPLDDALRLGVSAATLTLRYQGAVVPDLSLEKLYNQLVI